MYSIWTFYVMLGLVSLLAVSGTVAGLWQAWPRGGRGWSWKRAWLLFLSAIFLAAIVTFIVFFIIASFNVDQ